MSRDPNNPLNLGLKYTWQAGDTMALIAPKYRRAAPNEYIELVDLNKMVLRNNRYLMREGDIIDIPPHWFPLRTLSRDVTNFKGSYGYAK